MTDTKTLDETLRSPLDGTENVRLATTAANWRAPLSSIFNTFSRTKLLVATHFYVRADGSDANNGSANTAAGAWLTLQGAMHNIATKYDINGQTIFVHVGVGTFVGFSVESTVGGGQVLFFGGGQTTIIESGNNDNINNWGECFGSNVPSDTAFQVGGATMRVTIEGASVCACYAACVLILGDWSATAADIWIDLQANAGALIFAGQDARVWGAYTNFHVASNGHTNNGFSYSQYGYMYLQSNIYLTDQFTIASGAGFATAIEKGVLRHLYGNITEAVPTVGAKFNIDEGGLIETIYMLDYGTTRPSGVDYLPGSLPGIKTSGSYNNIAFAKQIGIGIDPAANAFEVSDESTFDFAIYAPGEGFLDRYSSLANDPSAFYFEKARGAYGAPTTVVNGDEIGLITFAAFGDTWRTAASIYAIIDDVPSAGSIPMALSFKTGVADYGTERLRITSDGKVGIGIPNPDDAVHVSDGTGWGFIVGAGYVEADAYTDVPAYAQTFILGRSRGIKTAPTGVQNGDQLGDYGWAPFDGTNWMGTARLHGEVDGPVSAGVIPTALVFRNGSSYDWGTERMRIGSNGQISLKGINDKQTINASAASLAIDALAGAYAIINLSANVTTLSVTNWHSTGVTRLTLEVRNTGAFGINFPAGWLAVGGVEPVITSGAGKKDVIVLTSADAGATVFIHNVGQNYSAIA